ncbi:MAG: hypothetical protein FD130_1169 [Halothiobacillaceae bacterium]|nr:MAG: hypothetical protein FD130_1169 [Halothiobacillaceae bacterium]
MANLKGKVILQWLLVITLVIQPVVVSYAMASMSFTHSTSLPAEQGHAMHHMMADSVTDTTNTQQQDQDNSNADNCCNTAACCPAALLYTDTFVYKTTSSTYLYVPLALDDVDPPVAFKPPRKHLT